TTLAMANADPLRLPAGTYKLRVELPGYVPIEEEIVAEIGQPYTYSYRLAPQTGGLPVPTPPHDAPTPRHPPPPRTRPAAPRPPPRGPALAQRRGLRPPHRAAHRRGPRRG